MDSNIENIKILTYKKERLIKKIKNDKLTENKKSILKQDRKELKITKQKLIKYNKMNKNNQKLNNKEEFFSLFNSMCNKYFDIVIKSLVIGSFIFPIGFIALCYTSIYVRRDSLGFIHNNIKDILFLFNQSSSLTYLFLLLPLYLMIVLKPLININKRHFLSWLFYTTIKILIFIGSILTINFFIRYNLSFIEEYIKRKPNFNKIISFNRIAVIYFGYSLIIFYLITLMRKIIKFLKKNKEFVIPVFGSIIVSIIGASVTIVSIVCSH